MSAPQASARGQLLVVVALGMTVFLLFVGLAVDYGVWLVSQRDMRATADAAAQAGVSELAVLPVTSEKQVAAAEHAMLYLNDQLGLGLDPSEIPAAASHASGDLDGFGAEDGLSYQGEDHVIIRTPVTADVSCTGREWGKRAVAVHIDHSAPRFFSRLIFDGDQHIASCATSAVQGGGFAVAVLKPPPSLDRTQTPNNSNITMKFGGTDSFVRVCGGDVAINSLFNGGPEPPPKAKADPAFVKFMKPTSSPACNIDQDNKMLLTIDQPSPPSWSETSKQVRVEGPGPTTDDDIYQAPVHLPSLVQIPGWGMALYAALGDESDPVRTLSSSEAGDTYGPIPAECSDAAPAGFDPVTPGKYDLLQTGSATGQYPQRWLCAGVYHFVNKPTGTQGLSFGSGTKVHGEGVTLVFENDSEIRVDSGAELVLNLATPAPWMTGELMHDVPLSIWIRPLDDCTVVVGSTCSGSDVFLMQGGAGLEVRGIIFGPTDNMKIAGNDDHHGAGELWAWTLDYLGNSQLDQIYEGGAEGYPVIVE